MKNVISKIDWKKGGGLVPAIIQDNESRAVLMLGYMNKQSLAKTLKTQKVWFYSRSKKRLWMKGETSRNFLKLVNVKPDCDGDALLVSVKPAGPTCHTGEYSCFKTDKYPDALSKLFLTIEDRKNKMPKNSYTASLFRAGLFKICSKVAEESGEVIKAATKESKERLVEESADLLYHMFVLLAAKGIAIKEIQNEIIRRQKRPPQ
jgi:phosphoribosyl-ATP pyrophosphohydrolase/phosphoribosyl-AMP cyclohydrolase